MDFDLQTKRNHVNGLFPGLTAPTKPFLRDLFGFEAWPGGECTALSRPMNCSHLCSLRFEFGAIQIRFNLKTGSGQEQVQLFQQAQGHLHHQTVGSRWSAISLAKSVVQISARSDSLQ